MKPEFTTLGQLNPNDCFYFGEVLFKLITPSADDPDIFNCQIVGYDAYVYIAITAWVRKAE